MIYINFVSIQMCAGHDVFFQFDLNPFNFLKISYLHDLNKLCNYRIHRWKIIRLQIHTREQYTDQLGPSAVLIRLKANTKAGIA